MRADAVVNALLSFAAGLAGGWWLRAASDRDGSCAGGSARGAKQTRKRKPAAAAASGGGAGGAAAKRAAPAVGRPRALGAAAASRQELKMVLCVNQGLQMGKGKVGAQCAHAAVGVTARYAAKLPALFRQWEACGQPKIALKVKDEQEMAQLAAKAGAAGLLTYIVHDAGRTQIAAGSQTVLAIGPAPKGDVDVITGHLGLL